MRTPSSISFVPRLREFGCDVRNRDEDGATR
jgi:hypothetical protein